MANSVTITKNLGTMIASLNNFDKVVGDKADQVFRKFTLDIFADIVYRSPVDKGMYRADWEHKSVSESGTLSAYKIVNNMPYAGVMEEGSPVGGKPWPSAGRIYKRKGKIVGPFTVLKDNRVWSIQMPEPVAGGAVESADWGNLRKELSNLLSGEI